MESHTIFCSACDRSVQIVARRGDWPAALTEGEVACAEHGVGCLGTSCPFCAVCLDLAEREEVGRGPSPAPAA
jgi:hypothetical protein